LRPHHRPCLTLFPYTTLFRSKDGIVAVRHRKERFPAHAIIHRQFWSHLPGIAAIKSKVLRLLVLIARRTLSKGSRISHEKVGERSEEHTSELQSRSDLVCRLL